MARVSSVSPASLAPIGAWPEHVVGATWRWHPMLLRTQRELSEGLPGPRRPRAGSLTSQLTVCVGRRRASGWPGPPDPLPAALERPPLRPRVAVPKEHWFLLARRDVQAPGVPRRRARRCAHLRTAVCDGGGGHPRPASRPVLRRPAPRAPGASDASQQAACLLGPSVGPAPPVRASLRRCGLPSVPLDVEGGAWVRSFTLRLEWGSEPHLFRCRCVCRAPRFPWALRGSLLGTCRL